MSVDTPEQRHDERRNGERRRNNRRTTDPLISPPYYDVFDRMAAALEHIESALASLALSTGTDPTDPGQSHFR